MKKLFSILVFGFIGWQIYHQYPNILSRITNSLEGLKSSSPIQQESTPPTQQESTVFQCDGRQHCSQMASRKEAAFFLENCPDVKMDGDNDGVPCEQQFGH